MGTEPVDPRYVRRAGEKLAKALDHAAEVLGEHPARTVERQAGKLAGQMPGGVRAAAEGLMKTFPEAAAELARQRATAGGSSWDGHTPEQVDFMLLYVRPLWEALSNLQVSFAGGTLQPELWFELARLLEVTPPALREVLPPQPGWTEDLGGAGE